MKNYNIVICGVGGTGVIAFGTLLKEAAALDGISAVGSEKRGRAQRGGAVVNTMRFIIPDKDNFMDGKHWVTGSIPDGCADLMIATEPAESIRNSKFLSKRSNVIVNTFALRPIGFAYPDTNQILNFLRQISRQVYPVNANQLSMKFFRSYRMANYILLGTVLSRIDFPIKQQTFESLLREEEEKKAFAIGLDLFALKAPTDGT